MNINVFEDILNNIHNNEIKKFTIEVLKTVPDYIETIPASSSGKYHPIEATKKGGLVFHIRRACFFANMFFNAYKFENTDIKGDIVLSALLLHDIGKKEKYNNYFKDYVNHPINAVNDYMKFHKDILNEKVYNIIKNCVLHHMGPWTPKSIKKDIKKYNLLELIVYNSDYLSSQKNIIIK